jgi:glucose-1-phosphate cytidylyltransferase
MLQHVLEIYARQGHDDFLIAGGYLINKISDWLDTAALPYHVQLIDTGQDSMTGKRVKLLERHLSNTFMLTYGDGLADVNLAQLLAYHDKHQSFATVTAVHPPARFGELNLEGDYVTRWSEKQPGPGWINGGFYAVEPDALEFIQGDEPWEYGACTRMVDRHFISSYKHDGFWMCVDYREDLTRLQELWNEGGAPWLKF